MHEDDDGVGLVLIDVAPQGVTRRPIVQNCDRPSDGQGEACCHTHGSSLLALHPALAQQRAGPKDDVPLDSSGNRR
jgi:hypothetical protein